jgi:Spy/CpxP family protein refolding chaperone
MKRSNLSLILSLTIVFLSGCAVGAVSYRYYALATVRDRPEPPRSPEEMKRAYLAEMKARLKLNDTQVQQLSTILDETRDKYREVRERTRPEMHAIQEDQIARTNAILSAGQQAEYAKMRKERDERRKAQDAKKKRGPDH